MKTRPAVHNLVPRVSLWGGWGERERETLGTRLLEGTPIYFLGRDVPTVRVSFSGSSVLNRVYIFRFSCLKQGRPRKSLFLPLWSHNFRWFRAPSLKCGKTQTYVPFLVFWVRPAWSSLEQGKELQHFLLDRVAKFTSFASWTGSGFRWVGRTPYPNSCWVPPPPSPRVDCTRGRLFCVSVRLLSWAWTIEWVLSSCLLDCPLIPVPFGANSAVLPRWRVSALGSGLR